MDDADEDDLQLLDIDDLADVSDLTFDLIVCYDSDEDCLTLTLNLNDYCIAENAPSYIFVEDIL